MNGERYDLYFGSLKAGVVIQSDSDFPNLWGEFIDDPALAEGKTPELSRFARFLALNRECTRLMDLEEESPALEEANVELETDYADFIESDDWRLVDLQGRELPILVPLLRGPAEIVWRWNPHRD